MASSPKDPEIAPNLEFAARETPYKKITIKRMPEVLYQLLQKRAAAYTLTVPIYCRAALECALENQHLYKGPVKTRVTDKVIADEINVPVVGEQFLHKLKEWRPYGHSHHSKIAVAVLLRHLDVMNW